MFLRNACISGMRLMSHQHPYRNYYKEAFSTINKVEETSYVYSQSTTHYMETIETSSKDDLTSAMKEPPVETSPNQERYWKLLNDPQARIIFVVGPAGSGKTFLACQYALEAWRDETVAQIVVTKPLVTVDDEQVGFLPGGLDRKLAPWMSTVLPLFAPVSTQTSERKIRGAGGRGGEEKEGKGKKKKGKKHPHKEGTAGNEIDALMESKAIQFLPMGHMRGQTICNAFVIADEMQNSSPSQMKMLLTRIGQGTRMIITGDMDQQDRGGGGLADIVSRLKQAMGTGTGAEAAGLPSYLAENVHVVCLDEGDIRRDPLVKEILRLYQTDPKKETSASTTVKSSSRKSALGSGQVVQDGNRDAAMIPKSSML